MHNRRYEDLLYSHDRVPVDIRRKLNVRKTFRRRPGQHQKDLHKWKYEKLSKLRRHVVMNLTAPVDKYPIHQCPREVCCLYMIHLIISTVALHEICENTGLSRIFYAVQRSSIISCSTNQIK